MNFEHVTTPPVGVETPSNFIPEMRWHHADKVFKLACGYRGNFSINSPRALARDATNIEVAITTHFPNAKKAPQYVGANLQRTGEFFHLLFKWYDLATAGSDDTEIILSANPKKDPLCQLCIKHEGAQAHCFTEASLDERVRLENKFANAFREWAQQNPLWAQNTTFTEELSEPGQTIPSIVAHTTLGVLRRYYSLEKDPGIYFTLFRRFGDRVYLQDEIF